MWVSRHVLELMGDLPTEVAGGHIVRDNQGNPTGATYYSPFTPSEFCVDQRAKAFLWTKPWN